MADENIVIRIEFQAEDGTIKTAFANVEKAAEKASDNIGKSLSKKTTGEASALSGAIGGIGKAFIGLAAGAFALNSIKNAISGAIREAREGEDAVNRLSAAFAQNGVFSKQAVNGFVSYADQLSRLTGIDDDLIVRNGALLSSLTGLTGQGLERATRAALDLAQATGRDLGSATQLLSRAANGGEAALKKYGIVIDESIPKSQRFEAALAQIEKRFGGLADSRLNTFSGSVDNLSNAFGDLQKVFGNLIVESPSVRAVLKVTADLIRDLADNLKSAFQGDIVGNFLKQIFSVGQSIATNVLPPIEIAFNLLRTGFLAIQTVVLGLAQPLIRMQALIIDNLVLPFVNLVLPMLSKVASFISSDFGRSIDELNSQIQSKIPQATQAAGQLAGQAYEASLNSLVESSNSVMDTSVSTNTQNLISKYQLALDQVKELQSNFVNSSNELLAGEEGGGVLDGLSATMQGFREEADKTRENFDSNFKQIGSAMFKTIGVGAGQAFAAFGAAVKKGEKPLDAFANAMLAAFGQAFVQLGTGYILQGAAAIWAGDPRGPGLIAAGAALATFGGILGALGGGGAPTASAPSGGESAPNATIELEDLNQLEQQGPRNQITLNVNGDVLDSNETGVRLTEILREFADKNGNTEVLT